MVGELYDRGDPRRDAGFSLFYMSINVGALASPLIVGAVREKWGFHAGFSVAAIGMAFAILTFVLASRTLHGAGKQVPNPLNPGEGRKVSGWAALAVAAFGSAYLLAGLWQDTPVKQFIDAVSLFAFAAPVAYFMVMFRSPKVTAAEKKHVLAYIPLWVGGTLFWMVFEQAAGKMAFFAESHSEMLPAFFGWHPTAETFQSVNPLTIVLLAPLFAFLWRRRAGRFPSLPTKFAIAVAMIGVSALLLAWMFAVYNPEHKAPAIMLVSIFVIQTVAELFLSPVGLSATTLLAPAAFASQAMALWFLTSSTGQALAAQMILAMEDLPDSTYYMVNGAMTLGVALLLFLLVPWTRRMMADLESEQRAGAAEDAAQHV